MKQPATGIIVAVILTLGSAPHRSDAQLRQVRVEFRLKDKQFVQAFEDSLARLEPWATALLVPALAQRFRFLSFTGDPTVPTARQLVITLDQRDRRPSARRGEVGLHVRLRNPPADSLDMYWVPFRLAGGDLGPGIRSVDAFLAEFGALLGSLERKDWPPLLDSLLSQISIADSAATAWGSPTAWLLPFTPDDLCIDTRTGEVRVDNEQMTATGPADFEAHASTNIFRPPDSTGIPREVLERYRNHIHAKPKATTPVPPADSLRVRGVYMVKYEVDRFRCGPLSQPGDAQNQ